MCGLCPLLLQRLPRASPTLASDTAASVIAMPGAAATIPLKVDMLASGPAGRPIPVGVTAFQPGIARR